MTHDVVIVGGGLGGLTLALRLAQGGWHVALLEKRQYPFHKVCGEYVSEEARPYLQRLGIDVAALGARPIRDLVVQGQQRRAKLASSLPLGGFGISRYTLDNALAQACRSAGVDLRTNCRVQDLLPQPDGSTSIHLAEGEPLYAPLVIGAWGKRESLDARLHRPFLQARTGWLAVKYHVRVDFPLDRIALFSFPGGYCGLSAVDGDRYCLCYLARRDDLRRTGSIPALETEVLGLNPQLRAILQQAEVLYDKPEVINEFSFARKETTQAGVWFMGDTAGLIAPLCGNGMAMAIHAGKLLADVLEDEGWFRGGKLPDGIVRQQLAGRYTRAWRQQFATRLAAGRTLQRLLVVPGMADGAIGLVGAMPQVWRSGLIGLTHGRPF